MARISTIPFFVISQLGGQLKHLHSIGMNVLVVSSHGEEMLKYASEVGVTYEAVEIERKINISKDLAALRKMYAVMKKYRVQIVHTTTPKAGLITAIAALLARVPVRLHTFTGQRWVTLKGMTRLMAKYADKFIAMLNTHCYADSPSQRAYLVRERIAKEGHLSVMGHGSLSGVDMVRFSRERWTETERAQIRGSLQVKPGSNVLLYLGRLSAEKGLHELLRAVEQLLNEGLAIDLFLVGPLDDYQSGEGLLARAGVSPSERIHIHGYTDCPERYLAITDLYCLPSYREGFGTSVIEAAAMGIPTVGTDIDGLRDSIVHGETGLLVPPRDTAALKNTIRQLIDDGALKARLGEVARKRCAELYTSQIINASLEEEYGRLLKGLERKEAIEHDHSTAT